MGKTFVSFENSTSDAGELSFDVIEPMQSKAVTASYRCKLYRAHLEQGAASRFITPHFSTQSKNAADQPRA